MTATATILESIEHGSISGNANGDGVAEKTITEFSARQAAITSMRQRFTGLTCATPKDYESTREAIAELRTFRVEVDKRRKVLNADAQSWIKSVNAESKRLIEEAESIEGPLKAMKEAVDDEKARKKAELEAAQRARLEAAARQKAEEEAAKVKAEQEAQAAAMRAESERLVAEREKINAENRRLAMEREKIEAERQAAEWKLELARREQAEKEKAAREKFEREQREWQEKVEAAERAEREKQEAAEKAERERQAAALAEQQRREIEEREKRELAEWAAAEAERIERMKPDVEKVRGFGAKVAGLIGEIPDVASEAARNYMIASREYLERMAGKLQAFGS